MSARERSYTAVLQLHVSSFKKRPNCHPAGLSRFTPRTLPSAPGEDLVSPRPLQLVVWSLFHLSSSERHAVVFRGGFGLRSANGLCG